MHVTLGSDTLVEQHVRLVSKDSVHTALPHHVIVGTAPARAAFGALQIGVVMPAGKVCAHMDNNSFKLIHIEKLQREADMCGDLDGDASTPVEATKVEHEDIGGGCQEHPLLGPRVCTCWACHYQYLPGAVGLKQGQQIRLGFAGVQWKRYA